MATWPVHINLLDLITHTILGKRYKLWSSSLCSFLHFPFAFPSPLIASGSQSTLLLKLLSMILTLWLFYCLLIYLGLFSFARRPFNYIEISSAGLVVFSHFFSILWKKNSHRFTICSDYYNFLLFQNIPAMLDLISLSLSLPLSLSFFFFIEFLGHYIPKINLFVNICSFLPTVNEWPVKFIQMRGSIWRKLLYFFGLFH